jgi:2',3'-cyclic-nucleotide 2'-phosphodiesterase (5'-nucleotidase family)
MAICLSNLAYPNNQNKKLNKENKLKESCDDGIDIDIDGHSHSLFLNTINYKNKNIDFIIMNQAGGAEKVLVRRGFEFTKFSGKKLVKSHTISVSQKIEE